MDKYIGEYHGIHITEDKHGIWKGEEMDKYEKANETMFSVREGEMEPDDHIKCPGCKAWVHAGATGCKCGEDFEEEENET